MRRGVRRLVVVVAAVAALAASVASVSAAPIPIGTFALLSDVQGDAYIEIANDTSGGPFEQTFGRSASFLNVNVDLPTGIVSVTLSLAPGGRAYVGDPSANFFLPTSGAARLVLLPASGGMTLGSGFDGTITVGPPQGDTSSPPDGLDLAACDGLGSFADCQLRFLYYTPSGKEPPPPAVPEPATLALLASGLGALAAGRRRR